MEIASWKIVLLEWANLSGYLDRVYFNLNQTDIEHFFLKFKSTFTTVKVTVNDCSQFLKAYYPEFESHSDDDGQLSSEDYIYIYSLFLHFSCVLHPVVECQEICKNMKETSQLIIAKFFQTLVEDKKFTKDALRVAFYNAVPSDFGFGAGGGGGGGGGNSNGGQTFNVSTPLKLNVSSVSNYSPPTPKSKMLEEWNIEMKNLKAQLETERYEKGFLEVQMKQYEEKNKKLTNEHRQLLNDIHDLKNSLLIRDTENLSANRNITEELVKRRLLKEISEKDEQIIKLKLNINDLQEDKSSLAEEIEYARKQYGIITATANELDFQLNQMKSNLEDKDVIIQNLQSLNNELETFISESRGTNKLSILDSSIDNSFNYSTSAFNMGSGNSGSPNVNGGDHRSRSHSFSPENLGRSVIDIQLKEEKLKNKELCESIDRLKGDNKRISENLNEFIKKHSITFNVWDISDLLSVTDGGDGGGDISENFMIYINYFEKLTEKYIQLETDLKSKSDEFNRLVDDGLRIKDTHEVELKKLVRNKSEIELANNTLKAELIEKENDNKKFQLEIGQCQEKLQTFEIQCANLNDSLRKSKEYGEQAKNEIQSLNIQLHKLNDIQKTNEFELNDLRQNIVKLNEFIVELESVKNQLSDENTKQKDNLNEKTQRITELNLEFIEINKILGEKSLILNETLQKYNRIKVENDDRGKEIEKLIESISESEYGLDMAEEHLTNCETESIRLQSEISMNEKTITDLTANVKHLTECNSKMYQESMEFSQSMDVLIDNNNKFAIENQQLTEELALLKKSFTKLNQNYNKKLDNCIELNEKLTVNDNEIQHLKTLLKTKCDEQNEITKKRLALETDIQHLNDIHFELKNNLEEAENTKITLNNENFNLNETIKSMQIKINDLNNLKLMYAKGADEFENEKRDLNTAMELLTAEKLSVETKKTELEYENQQLTITTSDLRRQLQEINIIRNEMEIEKIRISTEYEEVLIKNDILNEEISSKTLECTNLKSESDHLRLTNDRLTIEKTEIVTELNGVKKENTALNVSIAEIQNELGILQKEKLQFANDLETNANALLELQNLLELKLIDYEKLSVSCKALENRLKNKEIEIENANVIIDELRRQLDNLNKEKLNFVKRLNESSCLQKKYENTMEKFIEIKMFLSEISQQITNELSGNSSLDACESNNVHKNTNGIEYSNIETDDLPSPIIVELESISKDIEKKLKEKQNKLIQLNEQKNEYTKLYNESINQTDSQRIELEISNKKILNLELQISKLNEKLNDNESLKSDNEKLLQIQIEDLNKTIQFDKNQLKFANSKIFELEIRLSEMETIKKTTDETFEAEIAKFQDKIHLLQTDNQTVWDKYNEMEKSECEWLTREREMKSQNLKFETLIAELKTKIDMLKADNEMQVNISSEKLRKLEIECENKNVDLNREHIQQIDEYKQELIENLQQINNLKTKISENDMVLKQSIEENQQLKEQITDLEKKIKDINNSYENSLTINTKQLSDMESIVKETEEIKLKYENLLLNNENTQKEISQLKSSLAENGITVGENQQLKEKIIDLEKNIKEINEINEISLANTTKKLSDMESIVKDTELKYENLLSDNENTQKEISQLKSSLAKTGITVEENQQLKEKIIDLEKNIKEINEINEISLANTTKKLFDMETIVKETEEIKLKYENLLLDNENSQKEISQLKSSLAENGITVEENQQLKEKIIDLEKNLKEINEINEISLANTTKKLSDMETIVKDTEEIKLKYEKQLLDNENTQKEISQLKSSLAENGITVEENQQLKEKIIDLEKNIKEINEINEISLANTIKKLSDMELIVKETEEIKLKYEKLLLDNENTQKEISQLKLSLAENGKTVEANQQLKEKITDLEKNIKEINEINEISLATTTKKLFDMETIVKETEEIKLKNEHLLLDNENTQKEISQLKLSLAENGKTVEENQQLKEKITDLEKNIKEIKAINEISLANTTKKLSDMETIVKETEEIKLKYENLLLDNENTQKEISQLKLSLAENGKTVEENQQLKEKITDLEKNIKEINERNANSLTITTIKLSDMESIAKETEDKLKYETEKLQNEIATLNQKILNDNLITENQIKFTASKLCDVNNKLKESHELNEKLKIQFEDTTKSVQELNENILKLKLDNENLTIENVKLVGHNQTITEQSNLKKELIQITNENTKLTRELQKANEMYQCTDDKLTKQQLQIKILSDEKSTLENQIKSFMMLHSKEEMEDCNKKKEAEKLLQKHDANQKQQQQSLTTTTTTIDDQHPTVNVIKQQNEKLKQDVAILQAKLYKHRDMTKLKEEEWQRALETTVKEQKLLTEKSIKENRLELEGKLDKMKAKMKDLYNEEITRVKQKHEQEIFEYKTQVHQQKQKLEQFDLHVKKLSKQIFQLNEKQLDIQKENEFYKSKIRTMENHPSSVGGGGGNKPRLMLPDHLKMEDEEGELFNNTYLHDLKNGGKLSPTGRQSVRYSELQFRNSLCPPHLRSAYAAQYQDQDFREEDIKSPQHVITKTTFADLIGNCILPQSEHKNNKQITYRKNLEDIGRRSIGDDSLLSGQSDVRRGTIYKRPGPPTPSKNGGRLSFGGGAGEIMPREIFKEIHSNQYNVQASTTTTTMAAPTLSKKTTPGKIRSMFTSSKVKDENSTPTRRRLSIFKSRFNK